MAGFLSCLCGRAQFALRLVLWAMLLLFLLEGYGHASVEGERVALSDAQLFIPDGFRPDVDGYDITLHLHGSAEVAERNFMQAKLPGVLVTVALRGLSGVYTAKFRNPEVFWNLLGEVRSRLQERGIAPDTPVRSVTVVSFSAGFGGVREMLNDPAIYARINALVMLDSIYAGFTGDPAQRQVDPANMRGFLRFARDALRGKKMMIITHCDLRPDDYASTKETADYLLAQIGVQREAANEQWADGMILTSRFDGGRLRVYGFAGDTGADHMKHLHHGYLFLRQTPISLGTGG